MSHHEGDHARPAASRRRERLPLPVRGVARRVLQRARLNDLAYLLEYGLRDSGWLRSSRLGRPVDRNGGPLPWYTYAAIAFLEPRLDAGMRVFEYGAGHSTLWYAPRVGEVVAVEHDPSWAATIAGAALANVQVVLRPPSPAYAQEVARHPPAFEVVVVDGRLRSDCTRAAVDHVAEQGVVIWDNSDWEEFRDLRSANGPLEPFRELRFIGFGPCAGRTWSTSILYRRENCLGI